MKRNWNWISFFFQVNFKHITLEWSRIRMLIYQYIVLCCVIYAGNFKIKNFYTKERNSNSRQGIFRFNNIVPCPKRDPTNSNSQMSVNFNLAFDLLKGIHFWGDGRESRVTCCALSVSKTTKWPTDHSTWSSLRICTCNNKKLHSNIKLCVL